METAFWCEILQGNHIFHVSSFKEKHFDNGTKDLGKYCRPVLTTDRSLKCCTRSGSFDIATAENVVMHGSLGSALEMLAALPYSMSIETVFVIGGGQIYRYCIFQVWLGLLTIPYLAYFGIILIFFFDFLQGSTLCTYLWCNSHRWDRECIWMRHIHHTHRWICVSDLVFVIALCGKWYSLFFHHLCSY